MLLNDVEFHAHRGQTHMITLLVFLLAAGPAQPSADEVLLQALGYLKVRGPELHFPVAYPEPDERRLPLVDDLMTHPLRTPAVVDSLARRLESAGAAAQIVASSRGMLALPEASIPAAEATDGPPALGPLLRARLAAARLVEAAFDSLTSQQLDTLTMWGLGLLREDPDVGEKGPYELAWLAEEASSRDEAVLRAEEHVLVGPLVAALEVLAQAAPAVVEPATATPWALGDTGPCPYATGDVAWWSEDGLGPIVIGGTGQTVYTEPVALVVDLGGDDVYLASAGGTGRGQFPVAVCIDIAGSDTYRDTTAAAFGAGFMGVGLLLDLGGDDTYAAGSFSLGAGYLGAGALLDEGGNDRYVGDICAEGAAHMGVGILHDRSGSDIYSAALFSQAFGHVGAAGLLVDETGNDAYLLQGPYTDIIRYNDHSVSLGQGFGFGHRPRLSGGIGLLVDSDGNDTYVADIFGQGTSYWYALGGLVDGRGNDTYVCYQYAQGAGIHLSVGCLLDRHGDDSYRSKGVGQGCGHDYAAGFLVDSAGNDSYSAFDLNQGAGNANGLGVLLDMGGSDQYSISRGHNSQGYGNRRRDSGSLGVLLDLAGKDRFSTPGPADSLWVGTTWGLGWDRPGEAPEPVEPQEDETGWDRAKDEVFAERFEPLERVYILASRTEPKFSSLAKEAGEEIIERWDEMVPLLLDRLTTGNASERWRLADLFRKAGDAGIDPLVRILGDDDPEAVSCALFVLWRMKDTEPDTAPVYIPEAPLLPLLSHELWTIRASSARLLGMLGNAEHGPAVAALLDDPASETRLAVAVALGRFGDCVHTENLVALIADSDHRVRYAAAEALRKIGGECGATGLIEALGSSDTMAVALAAEAIGELGDSTAVSHLKALLDHRSTVVRGEVARALVRLGVAGSLQGVEEDAPSFLKAMVHRAETESATR
jgi:HEAT repeat protein